MQRIVRFGIVGACGTIVNLTILVLLVKIFHLNELISVGIAIEGSIIANFFLNHIYTFNGHSLYKTQIAKSSKLIILEKIIKFNLGMFGGALISFTVFAILFKLEGVPYVLADILAILTSMSWNYWISNRFVWKVIDE